VRQNTVVINESAVSVCSMLLLQHGGAALLMAFSPAHRPPRTISRRPATKQLSRRDNESIKFVEFRRNTEQNAKPLVLKQCLWVILLLALFFKIVTTQAINP